MEGKLVIVGKSRRSLIRRARAGLGEDNVLVVDARIPARTAIQNLASQYDLNNLTFADNKSVHGVGCGPDAFNLHSYLAYMRIAAEIIRQNNYSRRR